MAIVVHLIFVVSEGEERMALQGSTIRLFSGCENAAGKLRHISGK